MAGFEMKRADRIYVGFVQKFFKHLDFRVEVSRTRIFTFGPVGSKPCLPSLTKIGGYSSVLGFNRWVEHTPSRIAELS